MSDASTRRLEEVADQILAELGPVAYIDWESRNGSAPRIQDLLGYEVMARGTEQLFWKHDPDNGYVELGAAGTLRIDPALRLASGEEVSPEYPDYRLFEEALRRRGICTPSLAATAEDSIIDAGTLEAASNLAASLRMVMRDEDTYATALEPARALVAEAIAMCDAMLDRAVPSNSRKTEP